MLNDRPTGKLTPARLYIRDLAEGTYDIGLRKRGYEPVRDPRRMFVHDDSTIGDITLFVPIGFIRLLCCGWKAAKIRDGDDVVGEFGMPEYARPLLAYQIAPTVGEGATRQLASPIESPKPEAFQADVVNRLRKLKELKEAGILTDEEYETRRKALIEKL